MHSVTALLWRSSSTSPPTSPFFFPLPSLSLFCHLSTSFSTLFLLLQLDGAQAQLEAAQVELQDKDRAVVVQSSANRVANCLHEFINCH